MHFLGNAIADCSVQPSASGVQETVERQSLNMELREALKFSKGHFPVRMQIGDCWMAEPNDPEYDSIATGASTR